MTPRSYQARYAISSIATGPEAMAQVGPFLRHPNSTVRNAEGRGSDDDAFYRSLPFADLTQKNSWQWQIRARTYRYLESRLLPPDAMDIADLGAGNCWLSYRLLGRAKRPIRCP